MSTLGALVRATHPIPALAVTALVFSLAVFRGVPPETVAWILASTAAGQASVGWSNDYLDRFRDAAAGRGDKPIVAGAVSSRVVLAGAAVTLPLSVALSVPVGLAEAGTMLAGVGSAWAYNLGVKGTAFSWAPYAVSFGLVPVYVWTAAGTSVPGWLVAAGAVLGVAAHLVNVLPDFEADRAGSVWGLPHRLGPGKTVALACGLLAAVLGLVLALGGPVTAGRAAVAGLGAGLIGGVGWAGAAGRYRLAFLVVIVAAGAVVLLLGLSEAGGT